MSFVIVFEILFLILIASPSLGHANQSLRSSGNLQAASSSPADATAQVFEVRSQIGGHHQLKRPPDWPPPPPPPPPLISRQISSSKQEYTQTNQPINETRSRKNLHKVIYSQHAPSGQSVVLDEKSVQQALEYSNQRRRRRRRPGRTRRSPRDERQQQQQHHAAAAPPTTSSRSDRAQNLEVAASASSVHEISSSKVSANDEAASAAAAELQSTAELCYLASGGSSLTLTINEATPVGSIIGTIDVNGDPSLEGGNVDLLDGVDQASSNTGGGFGGGGTFSSLESVLPPAAAAATAAAAITNHQRQNRRLLGRRDTSSAEQAAPLIVGVTSSPTAAALTSPYYSLVGSSSSLSSHPFAALTTSAPLAPSSGSSSSSAPVITTTTTNQQQVAAAAAAVRVEPGTKNLILARPLDKESPEGESSLLVNVRCRPRQQQQQQQHQLENNELRNNNLTRNNEQRLRASSGNRKQQQQQHQQQQQSTYTTIPIRLIVTDANDHAPEFVPAATAAAANGQLAQPAYVINISETAPVNSIASRDILAIDKDSAGPHSTIHYRVLEEEAAAHGGADANQDETPMNGAGELDANSARMTPTSSTQKMKKESQLASSLFAFTNPLEPTLWLTGPLDYESLPASFTLTIAAQDQGEPEPLQSTAQVQVNVLDFDDQNPKFLDEKYTLVMDEVQASLVGQNLRVLPRNLRAEDGDRGINAPILYSFDLSSSSSSSSGGGGSDDSASSSGDWLAAATSGQRHSSSGSVSTTVDPALNIEQYLHLNPTSGELRLIRQWPSSAASLPLTLVIRATQADNRDRYALTTLTITRATAGASTAAGHQGGEEHAAAGGAGGRQAGSESANTLAAKAAAAAKRGIKFVQERVLVRVPEDTRVNEKIARVRANHLAGETSVATTTNSSSNDSSNNKFGGDAETEALKRRVLQLVASSSSSSSSSSPGSSSSSSSSNIESLTGAPPSPPLTIAGAGALNHRPISYQILDDQTDQFSINGLGEILLKKPLDYEQRQEFKFRVLATYTRYSDICHVHVDVINVNDNRPKFTQSQYSFQLTETRLRSNSIGLVQAHDADLNDTVHYSIVVPSTASAHLVTSSSHNTYAATSSLQSSTRDSSDSQQCAKLFEIGSAGQLSLKSTIRQLNVSQCQLIVQASDSLGAATANQRHTQQARVNVYVAPHLIGRSLNLNARAQEDERAATASSKLFDGARSLQAESQTTSWPPGASIGGSSSRNHHQHQHQRQRDQNKFVNKEHQLSSESSTVSSSSLSTQHLHGGLTVYGTQQQPTPPVPASQRSSLATVVASLQHMMKSVNFFEMPMSSALLLSVLLTFLVCLLLIVIISMSVHVYRRRSKSSSRVRHLTAAARMRHAHMVAAAAAAASAAAAGASSGANTGSSDAGSSPYGSASTSSTGSSSCSPRLTASGGPSPGVPSHYSRPKGGGLSGGVAYAPDRHKYLASSTTGRLLDRVADHNACEAPAGTAAAAGSPTSAASSSSSSSSSSACSSSPGNLKKQQVAKSPRRETNLMQAQANNKSKQQQEQARLGQLKISISSAAVNHQSNHQISASHLLSARQVMPANTKMNPLYLRTPLIVEPPPPQPPPVDGLAAQPSVATAAAPMGALISSAAASQLKSSLNDVVHSSRRSNMSMSSDDDDDDDDSSTINCGHYSVNGTMELRPQRARAGTEQQQHHHNAARQPKQVQVKNKQKQQQQQQLLATTSSSDSGNKLEMAISNLVRQEEQQSLGPPQTRNSKNNNKKITTTTQTSVAQQQQEELEQLTSGGQLGVRAYRRLPLMNSLVRPIRKSSGGNKVAPFEQLLSSHQQRVDQQQQQQRPHRRAALDVAASSSSSSSTAGLMALVRESSGGRNGQRSPVDAHNNNNNNNNNQLAQAQIKWPSESIPHKIKKLTWDDEMSCCDNDDDDDDDDEDEITSIPDSYMQMIAPVGSTNEGGACNDDTNYHGTNYTGEQNKFLFSLNSHMLPSLDQQQQQQQHSRVSQGPMGASGSGSCATADPSLTPRHNLVEARNNNQNNCLDYTIVESSQFHVDSLATMMMTTTTSKNQQHYEGTASDHHQQQQQRPHSSISQSNATFILNQNYQDLKLMTTAVL